MRAEEQCLVPQSLWEVSHFNVETKMISPREIKFSRPISVKSRSHNSTIIIYCLDMAYCLHKALCCTLWHFTATTMYKAGRAAVNIPIAEIGSWYLERLCDLPEIAELIGYILCQRELWLTGYVGHLDSSLYVSSSNSVFPTALFKNWQNISASVR